MQSRHVPSRRAARVGRQQVTVGCEQHTRRSKAELAKLQCAILSDLTAGQAAPPVGPAGLCLNRDGLVAAARA